MVAFPFREHGATWWGRRTLTSASSSPCSRSMCRSAEHPGIRHPSPKHACNLTGQFSTRNGGASVASLERAAQAHQAGYAAYSCVLLRPPRSVRPRAGARRVSQAPDHPRCALRRRRPVRRHRACDRSVYDGDPRPGAGGTTGAVRVADARPDGHTLLIHHLALAAAHSLYGNLRYATLEAFELIGLVNYGPFVLTSRLGFPADTVEADLRPQQ